MSLKGLVADHLRCRKCGNFPAIGGYPGHYYWWCYKCNREVPNEIHR